MSISGLPGQPFDKPTAEHLPPLKNLCNNEPMQVQCQVREVLGIEKDKRKESQVTLSIAMTWGWSFS